jgi:tetratricopeptide (TPR) repeat protein
MAFPLPVLPEQNPLSFALLTSWAPAEVPTRFAGMSISDFVARLMRGSDRPLFAAIDQLDILVSDTGSAGRGRRRQFLAELAKAFQDHPRLHLLLSGRSEALNLITSSIGSGARHMVRQLTSSEAFEAVTRPAGLAGRTFADGVAEQLIDDLRASSSSASAPMSYSERHQGGERVEPVLLQAVCHRLWEELPAGTTRITRWGIREFSDVDAGLAAFCSRVIMRVAGEHELSSSRLRTWLLKSFVTDEGTPATAHEGPAAIAGMPSAIARSLADRHLLASELRSSVRWYQLLSDRLVEPLRRAVDEHSASPAAGDFIAAAARELARGDLDLAQVHAERALRAQHTFRECGQARTLLGNVAHGQGYPGDAHPHYQEAAIMAEAADDTGAASWALAAAGRCLLSMGQAPAAVEMLRSATCRPPSDPLPQILLSRGLWELGEGRTAITILSAVLGIDGANPEALRARGEILADLGEARGAVRDLERAPTGDRPAALAAHGLALARLGDHPRASAKIHDAMAKAPWNGAVLYYAARAVALDGDAVSSRDLARRALDATDPPLSAAQCAPAAKLAE